jgi:hypothetical protein
MKHMSFCGKKNRDYAASFKNAINILLFNYIKYVSWGQALRPSRVWDTKMLESK